MMEPKPLERLHRFPECWGASKEELKAACEWYLKYKNKPVALLNADQLSYGEFEISYTPNKYNKFVDVYNEWLFRKAFQGVLE